jgi:hypothetical protein
MKRITLLTLTMLLVLVASAATARAHFPHEWGPANPPGWWTETLGPGQLSVNDGGPGMVPCVSRDIFSQSFDQVNGQVDHYGIPWGPLAPDGIGLGKCYRYWGFDSGHLSITSCHGGADHQHYITFNYDTYKSDFTCSIQARNGEGNGEGCGRAVYDEVTSAGGGGTIHDDFGWYPYDCRSQLPGWPNNPADVYFTRKCNEAKRTIKRAKKQLQRADTAAEEKKAKRKLRKAKARKREFCGTDIFD